MPCVPTGGDGLGSRDATMARMSPRIKNPHHPPRQHLTCTDDEVGEFSAGNDGGHEHLHAVSGDGPAVTSRDGRHVFMLCRVLKGASST